MQREQQQQKTRPRETTEETPPPNNEQKLAAIRAEAEELDALADEALENIDEILAQNAIFMGKLAVEIVPIVPDAA